jgi:hypothetical protein
MKGDIKWKEINNSLFINLNPLSDNVTFSNFPIFYLFDNHDLNKDLGYNNDCRKIIRRELDLDILMKLNPENIIDIGFSSHSTIIYKFENQERKYIYYSNSGLGIENQFIKNHSTACRIYYIKDIKIWNEIGLFIQDLIEKITSAATCDDCIVVVKDKTQANLRWAGSTLTTGSNNTLIGYQAAPSAITVSNEITLGDANITTFRIPGLSISATTTALTVPSLTPTNAIGAIYGGTGLTTYTTGDILYSSASNTLAKLSAGTNGQILTLASGIPSWAAAAASGTDEQLVVMQAL